MAVVPLCVCCRAIFLLEWQGVLFMCVSEASRVYHRCCLLAAVQHRTQSSRHDHTPPTRTQPTRPPPPRAEHATMPASAADDVLPTATAPGVADADDADAAAPLPLLPDAAKLIAFFEQGLQALDSDPSSSGGSADAAFALAAMQTALAALSGAQDVVNSPPDNAFDLATQLNRLGAGCGWALQEVDRFALRARLLGAVAAATLVRAVGALSASSAHSASNTHKLLLLL